MIRDIDASTAAGKEQALIANTPLRKATALRSKMAAIYQSIGDFVEGLQAAFDALELLGMKVVGVEEIIVRPEAAQSLIDEVNKKMNNDPLFLKSRQLPAKLPAITEEVKFINELLSLAFEGGTNGVVYLVILIKTNQSLAAFTGYDVVIGYCVHVWLKLLLEHPELPLPADVFFLYILYT